MQTVLDTTDILALNSIKGVGNNSILSIIKSIKSPDQLKNEKYLSNNIFGRYKKYAINEIINYYDNYFDKSKKQIDEIRNAGIQIIPITGDNYPELFLEIKSPPSLLFIKGNVNLLNYKNNIAIIGTRNCTKIGAQIANKTATRFAKEGFNIVSGLAEGIDTEAHLGALSADGYTTAILIDVLEIYPPDNIDLASRILDKSGLLISENPPIITKFHKSLFVQRDRLQSALSNAVFPIETGIDGGTMHTIKYARQQKKLIYCPDFTEIDSYSLDNKQYAGIRKIIKEELVKKVYTKSDYEEIIKGIKNNIHN